MMRKRPSSLRREVRELCAEVALLRDELATARAPALPTQPAPQPWDVSPPVGGCSACRWSGACNCVRYDRLPWCAVPSLTAAPPLDTTLRIAPGTSRMIPVTNVGACAGLPPVTIYDATGPAQPFTVHVENTTGCAFGAGGLSIFGGS